uniref:Nose resistant-to-fluoxetine protein N-terminal domain-containing protein n=1 Tax=Glossina morsitans morsitans TaxID=37546 RepID=A0A1B0FGS6_GLOMM
MFKKIENTKLFIQILQILLLVLTTTICYGLDHLVSNTTTTLGIKYDSNATASISSQDLHPHVLNTNITILHEVHDGSYSTKKKDRADILPLKPIKKKHYALLDKMITPISYEKSKPLKEIDLHPVVFDYNLGDLEDLEHESFKKADLSIEEKALLRDTNTTTESILHYKSNNNKDDGSEEYTLEDDLNVQVDIVTTAKGSNSALLNLGNMTTISPTSSTSLSSSTSVVTISPHIFKVSKTKSTKKGRELLKREDLQKSSNNHNSINHYFNEYNSLDANASAASLQSANVFQIFVNLYDHFYWQAADIRKKVSTGCGLELQAYLTALHGNYHWAQQAYDASGRYRGQLFFGNDKWLGQKSFCYELNRQLEPESRKHFEFEFYAALINMNLRLPKEVSLNLQLGECLPKSCSSQDIQHILDLDPHVQILKTLNYNNNSSNNTTTSVNILRVRTVPGIYSFWRELSFQIFASFMFTLIVLVIVATWYQCKVNDKQYIEPAISVISLHEQLLLCFAFQTNASSILNVDLNKEVQTSCVHGLRVISVLWTILVHTYLQVFSIGENRFRRIIVERSPWYQIVGNATFSVDTFFFISGFLVTLLFMKHEKKYPSDMHQYVKKGTWDTLMMLLYRYIRLTPAYLFVIFFNDFSLRETFNNSIFQATIAPNTCSQYWWRNILYVNNFYPLSEICMIWSWYMANEMQFYIMATILLVVSVRYFKTAVLTLASILISSWGVAGLVSLRNHYTHKVAKPFESFDFLYDKPWQRVGTYVMGMLTGYIIHKVKTPPKISGRINILLWILSLGLLALIIFGVWEGQLNEVSTAFYVSIGHTAFGFSLIWMVLSCCWGLTPTINRLLSYRCLWPLSRLTYCAYLIHPVIMLITAFRMDGTVQLNNVLIIIVFFGNAVVSFIAAFFISVLLEAPVVRLLKILLRK